MGAGVASVVQGWASVTYLRARLRDEDVQSRLILELARKLKWSCMIISCLKSCGKENSEVSKTMRH